MIEVQHLTKRYGTHTAVSDLSFAAEPGRIYGFLGPNGAGKTTTMNIMTGYLAASSGTVLIDGRDIQKEPEEAKRQIGYLPEVPPVYSDMTVYEYLKFAAELKKVPKAEREDAIEAAMQASEVLDVENRLIRNLSKGYRQRVGLAQALVGNPAVLILDEPTAGLDPEQQREMFDYIRSFKKDHTIILSSHILSDISAIADYVWIINEGKLVASDTPENLQAHLQSEQEIVLRVQGNREGIQKALEGLSRVSKVACREEADGTLCFTITSGSKKDIRPEVSRAAVYAGAAVLSMTRAEKSLEDVFFQLTGEAAAKAAAHNEFIAEPPAKKGRKGRAGKAERADDKEDAVPLPDTSQFTDYVTVDETDGADAGAPEGGAAPDADAVSAAEAGAAPAQEPSSASTESEEGTPAPASEQDAADASAEGTASVTGAASAEGAAADPAASATPQETPSDTSANADGNV